MVYDLENDWFAPVVGEVFTIWDPKSNQTAKLKCVETGHTQVCDNCYFNQNKCRGENFNMTNLLCLAEQRPDNKHVSFILTETL